MKPTFFTLGPGLGMGLILLEHVQAQTQTQTTQYYLNIHQFGQLGEIPGTTTLEHATVIQIGTAAAAAETTYLYLNAQTTETLIVSASGYEVAGSHPRECHYTAPDGGICEFARLESGVTVETRSTMGKPWGIAIPVSGGAPIPEATQADRNGIGVGRGRNDNGAAGTGSSLSPLGLVFGGVIGGLALVL
ncbi:hypothetical protein Moror_15237 [Moniliophthora roreri MCA 2997]|uniref:Uncharacterized protein n=1 Tax=Moniliophthora roreri (strain MCA 2997) TaxID=1381753 RepID=V2WM25_MONRO|nr:hypothetical protein Moror_15237 [Moniliophthora roreri MCA 2997]